jgi:uncharacterized protein
MPLLCGALFALGLTLAGLGDAETVLHAFTFDARWNPRVFAMFAGALLVQAPARAWLLRRGATLGGAPLGPAPEQPIDARLVLGSVVFGVGWGLAGICPGPAFLIALTRAPHAVVFFATMACGLALPRLRFLPLATRR